MKRNRFLKIGLLFLMTGFLAVHCTNPYVPIFQIVTPKQNSAFVSDTFPYALDVEIFVPQPGCGATVYPIDPATFGAVLATRVDGETVAELDVTAAFTGVLDPATAKYTWTGTVELTEASEYQINFTVANDQGVANAALKFRIEQPADDFPGGFFTMGVSDITQIPANCLINDGLIGIIEAIVKTIPFYLELPSGADILGGGNAYPITIALPYPLGNVEALLSLDETNNDILIDGPEDYTINLTGVVPPPLTGFDCIITAAANGKFDDVDADDLDGVLNISVSNVETSPGGTCSLVTPTGDCALNVFIDAD